MTAPAVTVSAETSLEDCVKTLEKNHIRRVPVVDDAGRCVGIVSQADLVLRADPKVAAEVLLEISRVASA
jgi:CBS domain-containing protein